MDLHCSCWSLACSFFNATAYWLQFLLQGLFLFSGEAVLRLYWHCWATYGYLPAFTFQKPLGQSDVSAVHQKPWKATFVSESVLLGILAHDTEKWQTGLDRLKAGLAGSHWIVIVNLMMVMAILQRPRVVPVRPPQARHHMLTHLRGLGGKWFLFVISWGSNSCAFQFSSFQVSGFMFLRENPFQCSMHHLFLWHVKLSGVEIGWHLSQSKDWWLEASCDTLSSASVSCFWLGSKDGIPGRKLG